MKNWHQKENVMVSFFFMINVRDTSRVKTKIEYISKRFWLYKLVFKIKIKLNLNLHPNII